MKSWNLKKLLIPPLIVAFLLLTWVTPFFRPYWDALDMWTFQTLNRWVQTTPFWQNFWAFLGTRAMDWIHDGIMLLFFVYSITKAEKSFRERKIAELIFTIVVMALTICIVNGILFPEFIHIPRKSPTSLDKSAFRLSSVIDWTEVKDHSKKSFPGDHATTAILFASLIYYLMGWRLGILATLYAIFFCLPRLVVGAHWLTDILLGSSLVALTITSLFMGTPLGNFLIRWIEKGVKQIKKIFNKENNATT